MQRNVSQTILTNNVLKAAAAGANAVRIMDRLDWYLFDHEDARARRRTESVHPDGMDPVHALAAKAAAAVDMPLDSIPPHQHPASLAVHYAVPMELAIL